MKTRFLIAAMLLLAFGSMRAQENSQVKVIRVMGSGDVYINQTPDEFSLKKEGEKISDYRVEGDLLLLSGSYDYEVAISKLENVQLLSSADVVSRNTLTGDKINLFNSGSGDMALKLDYDTVHVIVKGSGDIILEGKCKVLQAEILGSGDLNARGLEVMESFLDTRSGGEARVGDEVSLSELMAELGTNLERLSDSVDWKSFEQDMEQWGADMEEWGRKMEKWGKQYEDKNGKHYEYHYEYNNDRSALKEDKPKNKRREKKNLLYDANWNGFEAGLNMLLGPGSSAGFEGYDFLELRPMRSWVFNFNIADIGIAFNRRHTAGLFTGIGLGWNNYSFNHPVRLIKGENHLEGQWIDPSEAIVKRSKLGALYVQAPLMIEVRPSRRFYIAAGVTGGLRVDTWTKIKFQNGDVNKVHSDYYVNPYKLDASLRIGGRGLGFFAYYNLLPTFVEAHGPSSHTASFGFSLNF